MVTPGPVLWGATRSERAPDTSAPRGGDSPDRIGDYTVLRPLGGGAMGAVYLVVRDGADRARVLKRVAVRQPEYRSALKSEALVLLAFRHANIARVDDAKFAPADASDDDYIVLEHVAGVDVSRLMAALGRVDAELTTYVGLEIARGLFAAHTLRLPSGRVGIIHRDVKPANVMLGFEGEVKLIDFGVATLRDVASAGTEGQPEGFTGTLEYASYAAALDAAEQRKVDYDVYALGLVLRDMLAGPRPPPPPDCVTFIQEIAFLAKRELWPSLSHVDPELATLVERLTHRYPAERLTDLREIIPWLESILARSSRARVASGGVEVSPGQRLGATIRERFADAWREWGEVARRIEDVRGARLRALADRVARREARASVQPPGEPLPVEPLPVRPSAPPVEALRVEPLPVAPLRPSAPPVVDDHTTPLEPISAAQVRAARDAAAASEDIISSPPAPVGARERVAAVDVVRPPRVAEPRGQQAPAPDLAAVQLVAPRIPGMDGHEPTASTPVSPPAGPGGARADAAAVPRPAMTEQLPGRRGRGAAPEAALDDAPPLAPSPAPPTLPDASAVSRSSLGIPGTTHLGVPGEPNPLPEVFAGVERVGDYHCLEKLAEGGHGVIYLAVREGGTEPLVVKMMRPSLDGQDLAVQRFLREWKITSQLPQHRHLGHLVDSKLVVREFGPDAEVSSRIQVFRYVPSLEVEHAHLTALRRGHLLPHRVGFAVAVDALAGLAAAHAATNSDGKPLELFHRDLSPRNILLGFDGYAQVIDFGVAHAEVDTFKTNPGYVMGTLRYSSPELLRGEPGDQRSDIYAIGVVLIELLSGEDLVPRIIRGKDGRPREPTAPELLSWGREVDAKRIRCPDKVPAALWSVLLRALDPRPERRWRTAEEFRRALVYSTPEWAEEIEDRARIARTLAQLFPTEHADATARVARVAQYVTARGAARPALPATRTAFAGRGPVGGSESAGLDRRGVGSAPIGPDGLPVADAVGLVAPSEAARPRAASFVAVAPVATAATRAAPPVATAAMRAAPPVADLRQASAPAEPLVGSGAARASSLPTDPPAADAPSGLPAGLAVPPSPLATGAPGRVTEPAPSPASSLSHASHRASLELEAEESAGNRTRTEFRSELSAAAGGGVIIRDQTDDARGSLLSIPPLVYGSAPALGAPTLPPHASAPAGIAAWPAPLRWALVAALGAIVFAAVVAILGGERDVVVLPPPPATSAAPGSPPPTRSRLPSPQDVPASGDSNGMRPVGAARFVGVQPIEAAPTAPPTKQPRRSVEASANGHEANDHAPRHGRGQGPPEAPQETARPTPRAVDAARLDAEELRPADAGPPSCDPGRLKREAQSLREQLNGRGDRRTQKALALLQQALVFQDCVRLDEAKRVLSEPGP